MTSDVEDLLGVVQAAERRRTVLLDGEFADLRADKPGVAAALASALEKATRDEVAKASSVRKPVPVAAAAAADEKSKINNISCESVGQRYRVVVSEAQEEMGGHRVAPQDVPGLELPAGSGEDVGRNGQLMIAWQGLRCLRRCSMTAGAQAFRLPHHLC